MARPALDAAITAAIKSRAACLARLCRHARHARRTHGGHCASGASL